MVAKGTCPGCGEPEGTNYEECWGCDVVRLKAQVTELQRALDRSRSRACVSCGRNAAMVYRCGGCGTVFLPKDDG